MKDKEQLLESIVTALRGLDVEMLTLVHECFVAGVSGAGRNEAAATRQERKPGKKTAGGEWLACKRSGNDTLTLIRRSEIM